MTATIHHLIPRQQRIDAERYLRAVLANDDSFGRPLQPFGSALGGKHAGVVERAPRIGRTMKPRFVGPCAVCGEARFWCEHELGEEE